MSDCGRFLILTPARSCKDNLVYVSDLQKIDYQITGKLDLIPIVTKMEADYEVNIDELRYCILDLYAIVKFTHMVVFSL